MADIINGPVTLPNRKKAALEARLERSIVQADAGELVNWDVAEKWIESWGTENELPRPEPERE